MVLATPSSRPHDAFRGWSETLTLALIAASTLTLTLTLITTPDCYPDPDPDPDLDPKADPTPNLTLTLTLIRTNVHACAHHTHCIVRPRINIRMRVHFAMCVRLASLAAQHLARSSRERRPLLPLLIYPASSQRGALREAATVRRHLSSLLERTGIST